MKKTKGTFSKISEKITLDNFITCIGIIGQFAPYVQAFRIFEMKSAYAVSLGATLVSLSSMGVWAIYGFIRKVKPLIISNIVGIIGMSLVFIGICVYW